MRLRACRTVQVEERRVENGEEFGGELGKDLDAEFVAELEVDRHRWIQLGTY